MNPDDYRIVLDELNSLETIIIPNDGQTMRLKFRSNYPMENNEWGDFQYHRKVLGLICIARHNENVSLGDLDKFYMDMKYLYDSTLIDSRLVVLGLDKPSSVSPDNVSMVSEDQGIVINPNHYSECGESKPEPNLNGRDGDSELYKLSEVSRTQLLTYDSVTQARMDIKEDILYLCHSLFFVLESRRLSMINASLRTPAMLMAPGEQEFIHSLDPESK